ncbi:MAG TPA: hypothetical protein VGD07_17400 [Methylomirabilota bacterium]
MFSVYAFSYCVFGFPAGWLSDTLGPRRVIAAGGLVLAHSTRPGRRERNTVGVSPRYTPRP